MITCDPNIFGYSQLFESMRLEHETHATHLPLTSLNTNEHVKYAVIFGNRILLNAKLSHNFDSGEVRCPFINNGLTCDQATFK